MAKIEGMEFEEIGLKPREYQQRIFEVAKEKNTLVVLPTGLGKTLIAIMLAVERIKKYPGGKILILAPTRPLVEQHMKTFEKNLPELFAEMVLFTGSVEAGKRKKMFQTAEIVFSTPQCVANDLRLGLYSLLEVSLLVIDEAHRCLKNYDYTKVVETYKMQCPLEKQRILGLTASPGHDGGKIKEICKHLDVEEIEVRTRESEDVRKYLQKREYKKIEVPFPSEFMEMKVLLNRIYDRKVEELRNRNLLFGPANKVTLLQLQPKLANLAQSRNFNAMMGMSACATAIKISHAMELLETQTLSGLNDYLKGLVKQAEEKKSRGVQQLVKSGEFKGVLVSLTKLLSDGVEHPKIAETAAVVEEEMKENINSKIIVFTQFRDSGTLLARELNKAEGVRAQTFFGQAKRKDTGMNQKEQKKIIEKLNAGEINVLVATSIGEEGLDIAEVSAVIFYEPIPSAIIKIQRAGRTARLNPGKLIILMTKDTRDVAHHYASAARERKMYSALEKVKSELNNGNKEDGTLKDKTLHNFQ